MKHLAVYLSLALVAPTALGHAAEAGAPSFNCTNSATPIERAICADSTLGDLDKTLAGLLKNSLARYPARRKIILSGQRLWLAQRDRTCRSQPESISACLAAIYQTRIGQLRSLDRGADSTGVCNKIKKMAKLYFARPKPAAECRDEKCFYAPSPLDALAETTGSGVTTEKHAAELDISPDDMHELADWAGRAPRHFTLSKEVMQALKEKGIGGGSYVDRLPDSNFFAVSSVNGSAQCISSGYFAVEKGRARPGDGPKNWDDEESAGCGVARGFGTVAGTPIAFQDDHDYGPNLASSLSVAPWIKDHFAPFCTIEFKFAPRFNSHVKYNDWDESCSNGACDALREAGLVLVQKVHGNLAATEKMFVERLTSSQRNSFHLLTMLSKVASPAKDGAYQSNRTGDPAGLRDDDPLMLPVVVNGNIYLASLGHFTIGWRVFSDWSVTFDRLAGNEKVQAAAFAIGMTKGSLIDASVK